MLDFIEMILILHFTGWSDRIVLVRISVQRQGFEARDFPIKFLYMTISVCF
jgi:hypothetical protein